MKQAAIPILVLITIVGLAILTTWPSSSLEADHYQKFHDGKSLYALLNSRIHSGQRLDEVEAILGPATPLVDGVSEIRQQLQEDAAQNPRRYPEGVFDEDTFVTYHIENGELLLQLRNGYLVNHDPVTFEEYSAPADIAGSNSPHGMTETRAEIETDPAAETAFRP